MEISALSRVLFMVLAFTMQLSSFAQANEGREAPEIFAPKIAARAKLPLVVLLHGYAGNSSVMNYYFGLKQEVETRKFILVVPNGKTDSSGWQYWNATSGCCDFDHAGSDDVGYLLNLIQQMKAEYKIDSSKVFVVGHSNGGFMAHRLACEPQSPVSGIVSFAGAGFLNPKDCHASHPVSVLQIHAVDDDTIHFEGDSVGYPKLQPYPSVNQTLTQWLRPNQCVSNEPQAWLARTVTRFQWSHDTDTYRWTYCANGGAIELWKIRASDSFLHSPHTPLLTDAFAGSILDFLGIR